MHTPRSLRSQRSLAWLLTLLLAAMTQIEAGAGRTRPGGGSGSSAGKTSVRGSATYGHSRGHHGSHRGHYAGGYYHGSHRYHFGYSVWPYWGWGWGGWYVPIRVVHGTPGSYDELPGSIETDVRPRRAEVRVDGQLVGQTRDYSGRWDRLWLEPGDHVVEFSKPGYMTLRRQVKIRPGGFLHIDDRLQKGEGPDPRSSETAIERRAPQSAARARAAEPQRTHTDLAPVEGSLRRGLLRLDVAPDDAAVYLDGEFLARAGELKRLHGAIPVAEGSHSIEVVRPGYRAQTMRIDIRGPDPVQVEVELERGD